MIQRKKPLHPAMSAVPVRVSGLGGIGKTLGPKSPEEAMSNIEVAARKMSEPERETSRVIGRCNQRYEEHLERVRNGVKDGIMDEHFVISAILDFPLPALSHSLIVGDGHSEPLERLMNETNNERIRQHAREKLDLAISFIGAMF